jgi:hypothetical protein
VTLTDEERIRRIERGCNAGLGTHSVADGFAGGGARNNMQPTLMPIPLQLPPKLALMNETEADSLAFPDFLDRRTTPRAPWRPDSEAPAAHAKRRTDDPREAILICSACGITVERKSRTQLYCRDGCLERMLHQFRVRPRAAAEKPREVRRKDVVICASCGKEIRRTSPKQAFCSDKCRKAKSRVNPDKIPLLDPGARPSEYGGNSSIKSVSCGPKKRGVEGAAPSLFKRPPIFAPADILRAELGVGRKIINDDERPIYIHRGRLDPARMAAAHLSARGEFASTAVRPVASDDHNLARMITHIGGQTSTTQVIDYGTPS